MMLDVCTIHTGAPVLDLGLWNVSQSHGIDSSCLFARSKNARPKFCTSHEVQSLFWSHCDTYSTFTDKIIVTVVQWPWRVAQPSANFESANTREEAVTWGLKHTRASLSPLPWEVACQVADDVSTIRASTWRKVSERIVVALERFNFSFALMFVRAKNIRTSPEHNLPFNKQYDIRTTTWTQLTYMVNELGQFSSGPTARWVAQPCTNTELCTSNK